MKRIMCLLITTICLCTSCATISMTMKKPELKIDFNYPIESVWYETFTVLSSQSLMFERGSFKEGYLLFKHLDSLLPIAIIRIYVSFEKINDEKTKVKLKYNRDGTMIVSYALKHKINHLITTINTNLMFRYNETTQRDCVIYNLKQWLKNQSPNRGR